MYTCGWKFNFTKIQGTKEIIDEYYFSDINKSNL